MLAVGCTGGGSVDPGPTAAVERERIERIIVATGTIEPEKELEVRPRIAGVIEAIHVEAGDRVERNQPLMEIERELLEAQVREAEAAAATTRVIEYRYCEDRARPLPGARAAGGAASRGDARRGQLALPARPGGRGPGQGGARHPGYTQLSYATVRLTRRRGACSQVLRRGGRSAVSPGHVGNRRHPDRDHARRNRPSSTSKGLVDENEVARVALDQKARVRTEAYGDRTFDGKC